MSVQVGAAGDVAAANRDLGPRQATKSPAAWSALIHAKMRERCDYSICGHIRCGAAGAPRRQAVCNRLPSAMGKLRTSGKPRT